MEVVNPDPGPWRADGGNRLGEAPVDIGVDVPRLAREVHAVDEVVEERPERLVADPSVERLLLALRQQHRGAAVLDSEPPDLGLGLPGGTTTPGQPTQTASFRAPCSAVTRPPELGSSRSSSPSKASVKGSLVASRSYEIAACCGRQVQNAAAPRSLLESNAAG